MVTVLDQDFRRTAQELVRDFGGGEVKATVTHTAEYVPGSGSNSGTAQVYTVDCSPPQSTTIVNREGVEVEVYKITIAALDLEAVTPSAGPSTPVPPTTRSSITLADVLTEPASVVRVDPKIPGTLVAAYEVFVAR